MIEIKVDNDDGTLNWQQRAFVAVFAERLIGGTKATLLDKVKDNPEFAKLVAKEWDAQMRRAKRQRHRAKQQAKKRVRHAIP